MSEAPTQFEVLKSTLLKELETLSPSCRLEGDSEEQATLRGHMSGHLSNIVKIAIIDAEKSPDELVKACISKLKLFAKDLAEEQKQFGHIPDVQEVLDRCLAHCYGYQSQPNKFSEMVKGGGGGTFYR